jgi:hypothetical protein
MRNELVLAGWLLVKGFAITPATPRAMLLHSAASAD